MEKFTIETSKQVNSKLNQKEFGELEEAIKEKIGMMESADLKKEFNFKRPRMLNLSEEKVRKEVNDVFEDIKNTYHFGVPVKLANCFRTYPLIPYFKAQKAEIHPGIKTLYEKMKYDFYLIEVNFSSLLESNQYLRHAKLNVTLQDDIVKEERKSRFYKIYPENEYQKYFTAYFKGKVGIDANLDFKFNIPNIPEVFEAHIEPVTEIKAGFDLDLGEKTFRRAKIETGGQNFLQAYWIYNMSSDEYKNDDYMSSAILQIPREAKTVTVKAELYVSPYKDIWWWFDELLPPITVEPVELKVELFSEKK